ncbi:hypothetical protein [Campylobacter aviculae]|uniref:Periplasmic protein n=1 Tax=Campylobacter aviculae TaxID=2510190 RepID=A0A4U7BUS0_9BACT|nr:hypothetical protein [Campylobacter aviculae]TKX33196.1 hypothetical protein CQA76_00770 [Campylobacter aviculae]
MNLKIFSVIVGILIVVILTLGGTYYYLFEYSQPNYNYTSSINNVQNDNQSDSNSQDKHSNENYNSYANNPYINNDYSNKQETNTTQANNALDNNNNNNETKNATIPAFNESNQIVQSKTQHTIKDDKQAKIQALQQEINKQKKILEKEKALRDKMAKNTKKHNYNFGVAEEYLTIGKNSRLEPKLSTEGMQVYVLDGKFLSNYRIDLLKDILEPIQNNAKDYNLAIFVKMLPKGEMKLTIYNKDIIFSDMRKAYKYISIDKIKPYINTPEEIDSHVAREEKLKELKLKITKDGKGSEFSKHIKSLKTGVNTAQYFFPFCEKIKIESN